MNPCFLRAWASSRWVRFLLFLCAFVAGAQAQQLSLDELNRNVWSRTFHVTQAGDPAWLLKDDDGDGISNGAELRAGTDPASAGSTIKITSTTVADGKVHLTFNTFKGKLYKVLQSTDLNNKGSWTELTPPVGTMGNNKPITLDVPYADNIFYRVSVADVDTDGDGLSDWAEIKLGLDPAAAQSSSLLDPYGRPLTDAEYATSGFNQENVVSISSQGVDSTATQPGPNETASDLGAFIVSRTGLPAVLGSIAIPVTISGGAVADADYVALNTVVILEAGVRSKSVVVTPLANAVRRAPAAVVMTLNTGAGFTLGSTGFAAAVTILPNNNTPSGTGLNGDYYTNFYNGYTNTSNFLASNLAVSRTDPTVDFVWFPATGVSPKPSQLGTKFSVRWTGQVQPQYSETYTFSVKSIAGAVLKIGGKTLFTDWPTTEPSSPVEDLGSITLQAGVRYDVQLDYKSGAASAGQTTLSWYSESQPKQVIPTARLYPGISDDAAAPPTITSAPAAYAYLNQPFQFDITTSSNTDTTITLLGLLPPGLTYTPQKVNGANVGRISGTPTQAGDFQLVAEAYRTLNPTVHSSAALDLQVLDSGNGLISEVWTGLAAGGTLADIPVSTPPNLTSAFSGFEDTALTYGNNYGQRVRGYVTVPATGMYYFWVSANDSAEFWLSDDSEPAGKTKRASTTGNLLRQWNFSPSQRSGWLQLNAGVKYYLEVLHRGSLGLAHHLSLGFAADSTGSSASSLNGSAATVIPAYLLWKYYPPVVSYGSDASGGGKLYFTKMGAQGSAQTSGSGLCTLRLNADETQAVVKFNYSGLSTAVTGKHIHNDQYLNHPSQIIFDMDSAIPQPDGSYVWTLGPVGTFTNTSDIRQLIHEGKSYINIHTVNNPAGEIRGNLTIANGAQTFTPPPHPSPGYTPPAQPDAAAWSRFLTQATFGPTSEEIASLVANGTSFPAWINNQFSLPPSHLYDYVRDTYAVSNRYPEEEAFNGFWRAAVTAPDQLRQRIAFALSETLVISSIGSLDNNARALAAYFDTLVDNSFSNYRTLLKGVTLQPAMGRYLDMLGNQKGDITTGRIANENYAREILQLFSIGLNRLWPDGSLVLDSKFNPIPTYDQNSVIGFAKVFTGWNYNQPRKADGRLPSNFGNQGATLWSDPMTLFPTFHDLQSKRLLNNAFLPATTSTDSANLTKDTDPNSPYYGENLYDRNGLKDLDDALATISAHPNVGPFFCRQLIQRLVTSAPSPGYLYRVVQAFNGERAWDGSVPATRGDLREVIKAVLLDYEARSPAMLGSPSFGKQREPILRVTAPARYFLSAPVSGTYTQDPTTFKYDDADETKNIYPHRMKVEVNGAYHVANGDYISLLFGSGSTLPPDTIGGDTRYYVRPPITATSGATPKTTFYVDALGQRGATFAWLNNSITVSLLRSPYQGDSVTADKITTVLPVNADVYLNFFSTDTAPTSGRYKVTSVAGDKTSFTVSTGSSFTATLVKGVAVINELADSSYHPVPGASSTVITAYTGAPHGLAAGNQLYMYSLNGDSSTANGTYSVDSILDPQKFTFKASSALTSTVNINSATIFPLIAPPLTRNGPLTFSNSNWQMNITDSDDSSAVTQTPLRSPTVFNFFYPDYAYPGDLALNGFTTPEFQLTSDTTVMLLSNFLENGVQSPNAYQDGRAYFKGGALVIDMSRFQNPAATQNPVTIIDQLNTEMMGGTMSQEMHDRILAYVSANKNFPMASPIPTDLQMRNRVRAIVQLIITSTEYAIQR